MLRDRYGNALSTTSHAARDHYDQGQDLFLSSGFGAARAFTAAIEADPDFALGYVSLARARMGQDLMAEAKAAIAKAEALASTTDHREQGHINAFSLLLSGKPGAARAAVKAHVRDYPRDVMVAQLCCSVFGLIGFSGEVGREAALLAFTESLMPHYGEDWWMMTMHAFSLCEIGQLAAAQDLNEKSLLINPRNANAAHIQAHAQYEVGEITAGRQFLSDWLVGYDNRAGLHGHLSWHAALWALHDGDEAAMWAAVDQGVGPAGSKGPPLNVLTDTVAILHRAEMAGVRVAKERWLEISDYAVQFFPDTGQSFADYHAALGHAMAGDGERLAKIVETAQGFAGDLVRPVARAWTEMARENWSAALSNLTEVMASTERFGGSRAQRDLLELAYVNVLMKLGLADEARRTLQSRRPVLAVAPPVHGLNG